MAPIVFVEMLGRHDRVTQRHAITTLPCAIGRAYDNDVIVDDPFVHPHHARIDRGDDGALTWTDLVRDVVVPIDPRVGVACSVGRTRLRLRTASFVVDVPRAEPFLGTRIGRLLDNRPARLLALLSGVLCTIANAYWTSYGSDLSDLVSPVLGVGAILSVWAAVWTVVGRMRSSHGTFDMHLSVAALALLPYAIGECLIALLHSVNPSVDLHAPLIRAWLVLMLGGLVTIHALIIGVPSMRRAATIGASFATSMLMVMVIVQVSQASKFSRHLELDAVILPLPDALIASDSPEQFLKDSERLRAELGQDLESP